MATPDYIPAFDTIASFKNATINTDEIKKVFIRGYNAPNGRGGGLLNLLGSMDTAPPATSISCETFPRTSSARSSSAGGLPRPR